MKITGKIKKNTIEMETEKCNHEHCHNSISGNHMWVPAFVYDQKFLFGIITIKKLSFNYNKCIACGMSKY